MISVLMPWRAGCPWREQSRDRVIAHVRDSLSGCEIVSCDDSLDPFSRGPSVNWGAKYAAGDVFVIHDTDILIPARQLREAVELARSHRGLVLPFSVIFYLTQAASAGLLHGMPTGGSTCEDLLTYEGDHIGRELLVDAEEWALGSSGGVGVLSRALFETIGGFDPRFRGWGGEDVGFKAACETFGGPSLCAQGFGYHLWHPTDPTRATLDGSPRAVLRDRYLAARHKPAEMAQLRREAV